MSETPEQVVAAVTQAGDELAQLIIDGDLCKGWREYGECVCPSCTARDDFAVAAKALSGMVAEWRWQAFADSWLAIGLAAALAESEWGRASAEAGREWVAECVGRVVRRRKP